MGVQVSMIDLFATESDAGTHARMIEFFAALPPWIEWQAESPHHSWDCGQDCPHHLHTSAKRFTEGLGGVPSRGCQHRG